MSTPHPPPATPAWLAHYTTTTGNPDPRRAGREARPRTCERCGRLTLHGADHHRIAAYVSVDPYSLTPMQEAAAIIAGVPTYHLFGSPPGWALRPRTFPGVPVVARMQRADECTVVAAHNCDRAPWSSTPLPTRPVRHEGAPDRIPY